MSVFSTRPVGYKAGLLGLFFFSAMHIAGFGSPYWVTFESEGSSILGDDIDIETSMGLWMMCATGSDEYGHRSACVSLGVSGFETWFHFVRIVECLALLFLFVACMIGLSTNCCASVPKPYSRSLESWTGSAGILALSGTIVFFAMDENEGTYNWGIILTTLASVCNILCCSLIRFNNRPPIATAMTQGMTLGQPSTVVVQNSMNQSSAYPTAPAAYMPPTYPAGGQQPAYGQQQPYGQPQAPVYNVPVPDAAAAGYPPAYTKS